MVTKYFSIDLSSQVAKQKKKLTNQIVTSHPSETRSPSCIWQTSPMKWSGRKTKFSTIVATKGEWLNDHAGTRKSKITKVNRDKEIKTKSEETEHQQS